jgi:hypothetical protein
VIEAGIIKKNFLDDKYGNLKVRAKIKIPSGTVHFPIPSLEDIEERSL